MERWRIQTPSGFIVPGYGASTGDDAYEMSCNYADMMGISWADLERRGYRVIRLDRPAAATQETR